MSLQLKNLTTGVPLTASDTASEPIPANVNRLPLDGKIYVIYATPDFATTAKKSALVKNIRLVNTYSAPIVINLFYARFTSATNSRRRQISPVDLVLPAGFEYIDDDEIILESGSNLQDKLQASAKPQTGNPLPTTYVDFVISGAERDVS